MGTSGSGVQPTFSAEGTALFSVLGRFQVVTDSVIAPKGLRHHG
jgi:hypothetical protein